jgi:MoxR-like ATPase
MTSAALPKPTPETPGPALDSSATSKVVKDITTNMEQAIRGKADAIRLALTTLVARGHLLVEDVPGVGKTTLARALARSVGGEFRRVQFTSDLLPSDIVGVSIYDQDEHRFRFRPGPVFTNVLLADEINRTTPRTQSSLLEAMAEGQVSVDGTTYPLERPFMVMATQNPQEHFGTYPLPESQMDRFLMRIRMGYPERADERHLLRNRGGDDPVARLTAVADPALVRRLQDAVDDVRVDEGIADYVLHVVEETRRAPQLALGVSTRGALAWYRAGQAAAIVAGRRHCLPDDMKGLGVAVLAHRVALAAPPDSLGRQREESERIIADVLERVAVPT